MSSKLPVTIFNDVIGPVMRGPSSSHCAAALRIGRLARDLMDGGRLAQRTEATRVDAKPPALQAAGLGVTAQQVAVAQHVHAADLDDGPGAPPACPARR